MKDINLKPYFSALNDKEKKFRARRDVEYCHSSEARVQKAQEDLNNALLLLEKCEAKIDDAIKIAEGRARERTITAERIAKACIRIEDELSIPKKALEGVTAHVDLHACVFPNAYKYTPMSTQFTVVYRNGSWRLTDICRDDCNHKNSFYIVHTEDSKAALVERFSRWG